MDTVQLNNHVQVPLLGLGVFQVTDQAACKESVQMALKTGYRLIDTAACYGNERAVGEAVKDSGISRAEVFLTSRSGFRMQATTRPCVPLKKPWKTSRLTIWIFT